MAEVATLDRDIYKVWTQLASDQAGLSVAAMKILCEIGVVVVRELAECAPPEAPVTRGGLQSVTGDLLPGKLGAHALGEMRRAAASLDRIPEEALNDSMVTTAARLVMSVPMTRQRVLDFGRECDLPCAAMATAVVEYVLTEVLEMSNRERLKTNAQGVRASDIAASMSADFELCSAFRTRLTLIELQPPPAAEAPAAAAAEAEGVETGEVFALESRPPGAECRAWKNTERVNADDTRTPLYLHWASADGGPDHFALQRWNCGHWPDGVKHEGHDNARVKLMQTIAIQLTTLASMAEHIERSAVDSELTAFSAYVHEGELRSRSLEDVASFLQQRLRLPAHARARATRLPVDDAHRERMLCATPDARPRHAQDVRIAALFHTSLADSFFFSGADAESDADAVLEAYPVVYAGFTKHGDIAGVYAIRKEGSKGKS